MEKDQAELDLEKLVFGDRDSFGETVNAQSRELNAQVDYQQVNSVRESDDDTENLKDLPDADVRLNSPSLNGV